MGFSVMIRAVSRFSCRNLGHGESEGVRGGPDEDLGWGLATQVAAERGGASWRRGEQVPSSSRGTNPRTAIQAFVRRALSRPCCEGESLTFCCWKSGPCTSCTLDVAGWWQHIVVSQTEPLPQTQHHLYPHLLAPITRRSFGSWKFCKGNGYADPPGCIVFAPHSSLVLFPFLPPVFSSPAADWQMGAEAPPGPGGPGVPRRPRSLSCYGRVTAGALYFFLLKQTSQAALGPRFKGCSWSRTGSFKTFRRSNWDTRRTRIK